MKNLKILFNFIKQLIGVLFILYKCLQQHSIQYFRNKDATLVVGFVSKRLQLFIDTREFFQNYYFQHKMLVILNTGWHQVIFTPVLYFTI